MSTVFLEFFKKFLSPDISTQSTLRTRSWFILKKLRPKPENANYNILLLAISAVFYISYFKPQISAVSATPAVRKAG
ncbi:MAG: hypothetical protein DRP65_08440 [Planctomycetota bacterium]|nr:MAG: hypothetical protein DRP65_08440 [Planctomycetota bacterium]